MGKCEFCGGDKDNFIPDRHDNRLCEKCNTDPFRRAANAFGAAIGLPHHVMVEISTLTAENAALTKKLEEVRGRLRHFIDGGERDASYRKLLTEIEEE